MPRCTAALLATVSACAHEPVWELTIAGETRSGAFTYHLFGTDDDIFVDGYASRNPPPSERNVFVVRLLTISEDPALEYLNVYDLAIGRCTPVEQDTDLVSTDPTVELHVEATVICTDLRPGEELPLRLDLGP